MGHQHHPPLRSSVHLHQEGLRLHAPSAHMQHTLLHIAASVAVEQLGPFFQQRRTEEVAALTTLTAVGWNPDDVEFRAGGMTMMM